MIVATWVMIGLALVMIAVVGYTVSHRKNLGDV